MLKKPMIFFAFVLILVAMFSVCGYAADYMITSYDDETGTLLVNASIGESANLPVSIFALEESKVGITDGQVPDYPFSDTNSPALAGVCLTQDGGALKCDFKLSEHFGDGIYYVYAMSELGSLHCKAYIYGEASTGEIVEKCSIETDKNELAIYISESRAGEYMGYGDDVMTQYAFDVADFVIEARKDDYTHKTLKLAMGKAIALAMLEDGIDTDSVLAEYARCFGWNYSDYKNLDEDIKETFNGLIEDVDFTDDNLKTDFESMTLVAMVRNASSSWSELKELFEQKGEELGAEMGKGSDYANISTSDRPEVFEYMKKDLEAVVDFSKIAGLFDNAVDKVKKAAGKPSGGGGGGGGSSSGGGSSISTLPGIPEVKPVEKVSYIDIENHFSKEAAEFLTSKKILNGYSDGTFRPDNSVTRAEFAKMVSLAFSIEDNSESSFSDVISSDWFYAPVSALAANNILLGNGTNFYPQDKITRQDATVVVWRALSHKGKSYEGNPPFNDMDDVSKYAADAVSAMFGAGVIKGSDGSFYPLDSITRGEAAVIIHRAFKLVMGV